MPKVYFLSLGDIIKVVVTFDPIKIGYLDQSAFSDDHFQLKIVSNATLFIPNLKWFASNTVQDREKT